MHPLKILYWSQLSLDNITFVPVFFFQPDQKILPILRSYNFLNVPVFIQNTNGIYDGYYTINVDITTPRNNFNIDYDISKPIYAAQMDCPFTIYPYQPFIGEFSIIDTTHYRPTSKQVEFVTKKDKDPPTLDEHKQEKEFTIQDIENFELDPHNEMKQDIMETPSPKTCQKSTTYDRENIYVIIICTFFIMMIILILCFYGKE